VASPANRRRQTPEEIAQAEALLAMLVRVSGSKGGKQKRHLDELLDEGLKETFPASDPVAVGHFTSTEAPSRPADTTVVDLTSVGKTKGRRRQTRAERYGWDESHRIMLAREVHVSIGLGREVLQQLANAMTAKDLEAMEDADLQRLAEQLWRWHDEALRELLKRGHVVPKQKWLAHVEAEGEGTE
jgi:hypothetical protein